MCWFFQNNHDNNGMDIFIQAQIHPSLSIEYKSIATGSQVNANAFQSRNNIWEGHNGSDERKDGVWETETEIKNQRIFTQNHPNALLISLTRQRNSRNMHTISQHQTNRHHAISFDCSIGAHLRSIYLYFMHWKYVYCLFRFLLIRSILSKWEASYRFNDFE